MKFSSSVVGIAALALSPGYAWVGPNTSSRQKNAIRSHGQQPTYLQSTSAGIAYNVVLQPSAGEEVDEDEIASFFDSHSVGGARVHRYSRDTDPDSQTEYVMWYHGRTQEMAEDTSLPPLTTGRIGRAISRNGLHWEKDRVGSVSEDTTGVSLGLNKESWWGFDTEHVGLGNVLLPMSTPAVLTEGGVYLMYYMGGSGEETPVVDYIDKELPDSMQDAMMKGMKMRIGVAVSQDGITWGRVEGDDPTGACVVPYDKNDKTNPPPKDASIHEELYCAWPEVAVDLKGSDESSAFRMYYSTMTKEGKQKCLAYAVSPDGFRWEKKGIVLRPDSGDDALDAGGCARCCVQRDATFDEFTRAWTELDSWTMYYEGVSPKDGKHRIMTATSKDGREWTKGGLALDVGEGDSWDCGGVGSPHILRMDDGSCRMYYTGQSADGRTAIGVAKLPAGSEDVAWTREQATVTFADVAE